MAHLAIPPSSSSTFFRISSRDASSIRISAVFSVPLLSLSDSVTNAAVPSATFALARRLSATDSMTSCRLSAVLPAVFGGHVVRSDRGQSADRSGERFHR